MQIGFQGGCSRQTCAYPERLPIAESCTLGMAEGFRQSCQARCLWLQVQRLGSDVQQLEAESQRLLTNNTEPAQPNGRSEASSCGGRPGAQAVHSLELLDFSPNWDFTLGGSKVLHPALCILPCPSISGFAMIRSASCCHVYDFLHPHLTVLLAFRLTWPAVCLDLCSMPARHAHPL